jgi:hypothetical protein
MKIPQETELTRRLTQTVGLINGWLVISYFVGILWLVKEFVLLWM